MSEFVHCGVGDQVATLTLDSPRNRNALSRQLLAELTTRLADAVADPSVRVIVITHTGRVFCAGADLAEAGSQSMTGATTAVMALLTAIVEAAKPVIARITGHVRAGGMGIVGACDLALATETASFAFTEARIGVAPAMISLTTGPADPPGSGPLLPDRGHVRRGGSGPGRPHHDRDPQREPRR
jgi:enoyl-CoA hydratase